MWLDFLALNLFFFILFLLELSWKETMQRSELPSLFLYVQMSFYCPYLATAASARVPPHSGHDWAIEVVFVTILVSSRNLIFERSHEISCIMSSSTLWDNAREMKNPSPVPLVHKGINERSVSMPRKMQCNGGKKLRLTTNRRCDMPYTCDFAMTLPTSPSPHNAPAEAGCGGTGCIWGTQGVGGVPRVVLMFCPGVWGAACLKQRWSLVFC